MNNLSEQPQIFTDHLLLHITSSKENPNYKELKKILEDKEKCEQFNNKKIRFAETIVQDPKIFQALLYNVNMNLLLKVDSISNDDISKIFEVSDKYGPKVVTMEQRNLQKGGNISFKHKYEKYKQKYNNMKNVATSYLKPNVDRD